MAIEAPLDGAAISGEVIHHPGVPLTVRQDGETLVVTWAHAFAGWQLRATTAIDSPYWYDVEAPLQDGEDTVTTP